MRIVILLDSYIFCGREYTENSLTLCCKFLWVESDILVHISIQFGVRVIFIFCNVVADEPTNCCQQDLSMST